MTSKTQAELDPDVAEVLAPFEQLDLDIAEVGDLDGIGPEIAAGRRIAARLREFRRGGDLDAVSRRTIHGQNVTRVRRGVEPKLLARAEAGRSGGAASLKAAHGRNPDQNDNAAGLVEHPVPGGDGSVRRIEHSA